MLSSLRITGSVSLAIDYDDSMLKLVVEDTGTGMTEDEQQKVFSAFERLSNAVTKDGFGLGLSIVQRIVAMLGGTIQLEKSRKEEASRFIVNIPHSRQLSSWRNEQVKYRTIVITHSIM